MNKVIKNKVYDRLNGSYRLFKAYFSQIQDREKLEEAILIELVFATKDVMDMVNMKGAKGNEQL
jgi:hypothetical protein